MELILLERIEGLGNVGDNVRVRNGYGRNFLVPRNKAVVATDANRKVFERRRQILEEKQQTVLEQARANAKTLASLELTISRATSDTEHLYGSVSTNDLATLLADAGHPFKRRQIIVDEAMKTTGEHSFRVRLHPDVVANLTVKIESEQA
ncbi:MAG: 50S ribosomal protein L9 [Mariprofundaceae bacterium]